MQQYLLSLLIFTPLVAALIALFIPSSLERAFRVIAIATGVLQLITLVPIIMGFEPSGALQFVEQKPWITLDLGIWGTLKAEYFVALDGLNIVLVCLSVFVLLIASIASWSIQKNVKGYFVLLLILNAAIIGSFTPMCSRLNVCTTVPAFAGSCTERYKPIRAIRIKTEPSSVYKKNFIDAYSLRGPPQMPIRKNIGSNMNSKNK